MTSLKGLRIAVAGGGVFGLATAALAARRGASVTLFDPRALADNASGIAAGMLSPAFEAVLEDAPAERLALFQRAYEAWPAFAEAADVAAPPDLKSGALFVAGAGALEDMQARLAALGVSATPLTMGQARARQPALGDAAGALALDDDGRVDPAHMLAGLAASLRACGGRWVEAALPPEGLGKGTFDAAVLAAGFEARAWCGVAPELAVLTPIKGHILRYAGGLSGGATLRGPHGYAAPQSGGLLFGATMQPGRSDLAVEPDAGEALRQSAIDLLPGLAGLPMQVRTGVRAATPDGLPMVGRSVGGAFLAVGARRNGWLLAPLVAPALLAAVEGGAAEPAFDPARFGVAAA